MSQENSIENPNTGNEGEIKKDETASHESSSSMQKEVKIEDSKSIKQRIKEIKEEIDSIKEAKHQIASAHSYDIADEDIADQHIVELSKLSLEEKEKELYDLQQKNKQKNIGSAKKMLSSITTFFRM